ncbi:MAG TPA: hypothetical protein VE031_01545 [Chthoniobacterales bacterium]|nr:hypothetical protein [Chthoniobacterales bacterium]
MKILFPLALVVFAGVPFTQASPATPPATPPSLEVTATNGADREVHRTSFNGVVPLVRVRQNQTVPITLQFPSDKAGTPVAATPLDGGGVNRDDLVVLPTGKVIFTFRPGGMPGRYRLLVQTPIGQHLLEFYVVDPSNPGGPSR